MKPLDLLPKARTPWEKSTAGALEDEIALDKPRDVKDPWSCPVELLPNLAAEESVDLWSSSWPEQLKRQAIAESWAKHRVKGTPAAMDAAIQGLSYGATWSEWFEYGGKPFHFRIKIRTPNRGFSFSELVRVWDTAVAAKNVRSMPELWFEREETGPLYVGGYETRAIRIGELALPGPETALVAVGGFSVGRIRIGEI